MYLSPLYNLPGVQTVLNSGVNTFALKAGTFCTITLIMDNSLYEDFFNFYQYIPSTLAYLNNTNSNLMSTIAHLGSYFNSSYIEHPPMHSYIQNLYDFNRNMANVFVNIPSLSGTIDSSANIFERLTRFPNRDHLLEFHSYLDIFLPLQRSVHFILSIVTVFIAVNRKYMTYIFLNILSRIYDFINTLSGKTSKYYDPVRDRFIYIVHRSKNQSSLTNTNSSSRLTAISGDQEESDEDGSDDKRNNNINYNSRMLNKYLLEIIMILNHIRGNIVTLRRRAQNDPSAMTREERNWYGADIQSEIVTLQQMIRYAIVNRNSIHPYLNIPLGSILGNQITNSIRGGHSDFNIIITYAHNDTDILDVILFSKELRSLLFARGHINFSFKGNI